MFFRDLCICNKDWDEMTDLIIITAMSNDATPMKARAARTIFGERQVLWFKDTVVVLG